jgi:hypothetical protein
VLSSFSNSSSSNKPQLFKLIILSKVLLFNLFLNLLIIKAPCEKNLSEGAEVAGI